MQIAKVTGIILAFGSLWLFLQTNAYLTLLRWFWFFVFLFGGIYTSRRMIQTIDFDAPVLISFTWSTLGYLFLTLLLWFFAWAVFVTKERYVD